jgi:hypothetical protein
VNTNGVTCKNDNLDDGVSELNLASAGLEGQVPTSIYDK